MPNRLAADFYRRPDPVAIARELLGKLLVTEIDGLRTSGRIVETEAYRGPDDRACHAFANRRTARTEVMFAPGGRAYVYLCYGIHHLFNVVTGGEGEAHAVLIRAIEPVEGIGGMLARRRFLNIKPGLTAGPGALAQALGIRTSMSAASLLDDGGPIFIEEAGAVPPASDILSSKRIGVDYAGECAEWPWRFSIKGSPFVSRPWPEGH